MNELLRFNAVDIVLLLSLVAGCASIALAIIYLGVPIADRRKVLENLSTLSQYDQHSNLRDIILLDSFMDRVIKQKLIMAARWFYKHTPKSIWLSYERKLISAGNPRGMNADMYMALKVLIIAVIEVLVVITVVIHLVAWKHLVILLVLGAAVGYYGPDLALREVIARRFKSASLSLPDMLDLLTISVEAGLGFDAALSKIAQTSNGILADEFTKTLQEIRMGTPRSQALKNLAARIDVPELRSFITAIVQAEVFGTSIGNVLRTQAKDLRLRRRQKAEEIAQKAPVKMVFPLITCILPSLFTVILGPSVINIYNSLVLGILAK